MQNIKTIPQLAVQNLPADLESKADADEVVLLTGNQTVEGNKNLTETPVIQLWNADINPTANQTIVFSINSVGTFELYKNKTGNNGSNPPAQDGTNWEFISTCQGSRAYVQEFAASESPVSSVTLTEGVCYNADFMTVAVDHTILDPSAYTLGINGTTITFDEPVQAGLTITVRWFTEMNLSNVYRQPLLTCFWSDHLIYELSYLCADPFSWQDGNVYSAVYNHLVADIDGKSTTTEGSITYYLADDGHKIAVPSSHDAVADLYDETGVAWFYILDTTNHRFKLPRTKYAFNGWRGDVGDCIPESLPNITGSYLQTNPNAGGGTVNGSTVDGVFYTEGTGGYFSTSVSGSASAPALKFDASRSSSAYQNGAPVQQRGTQMYLYFYVGNYTPQAVEQTAGYAQTLTELKVDKDLANSPYTTNRILEIPQDIELELSNGTLTLKAGSKVYVPNGFEQDGVTPKFDVVTIASDATETRSFNTNYKLQHFYDVSNSSFGNPFLIGFNLFSGNTAPSGFQTQTNLWYDTSTNFMKYTIDQGSTWSVVNYSLPLCVFSSPTIITSIDQIFNGFGYIGSTVFALPGVKVQYPDELNTDGSYKTGVYTTISVSTFQNLATTGFARVMIDCDSGTLICPDEATIGVGKRRVWNPDRNLWTLDGVKIHYAEIGKMSGETTSPYKITSVQQYAVDSVANSNASNFSSAGRSYLSGIGMPSSKYEDWTLGATNSTYTAPANGYFFLRKMSSAVGQYIAVYYRDSANNPIGRNEWSSAANQTLTCMLGVQKGTVVSIDYNVGGSTALFQFIYAEGEN